MLAGGLLVLRWPRLAWLHVPAFAWGGLVELAGWICPLTHLENALYAEAAAGGYEGDFLSYWLLSLIYPAGLTRSGQVAIGLAVLALNLWVYARLWRRARATRPAAPAAPRSR